METPRGARFGEHKSSALFGFRRAVPSVFVTPFRYFKSEYDAEKSEGCQLKEYI